MKKIFIIYLIIVGVTVGIYGFTLFRRAAVPPGITPPELPTPNPSDFPRPITTGAVSYSDSPTNTYPTKLPLYTIDKGFSSQDTTNSLLSFFQVAVQPKILTGSRGSYFLYQQGPASIMISESPLTFTYKTTSSTDSFIHDDPSVFSQIAAATINKLDIVPSPFTMSLLKTGYLSPVGTEPNDVPAIDIAKIIYFDYQYSLDDLPVYVGDANAPGLSLSFNAERNLTKFTGFILPKVKKEDSEIPLIAYQDAVTRLQQNQGVLSSLSKGSTDIGYVSGETPKNIRVTGAHLGYYLTPSTMAMTPVFVFTGSGLTSDNTNVKTTTIVSALP